MLGGEDIGGCWGWFGGVLGVGGGSLSSHYRVYGYE